MKEDKMGMTCKMNGYIRNMFKFLLRRQQERGRRGSEVVGGIIV
jgi:hypothetical protein